MTVHTNCRANTEWLKLWELSGPEGGGERREPKRLPGCRPDWCQGWRWALRGRERWLHCWLCSSCCTAWLLGRAGRSRWGGGSPASHRLCSTSGFWWAGSLRSGAFRMRKCDVTVRSNSDSDHMRSVSVTRLSPGDIHENRETRHVVTLAADVGAVSENHLAAFRRPTAVTSSDTQTQTWAQHNLARAPPFTYSCTHSMVWFQKTQMGLEHSSVATKRNCTVMGLSSACCSSASLSCTVMLTTGVLMTGRFGTLRQKYMKEEIKFLFFLLCQERKWKWLKSAADKPLYTSTLWKKSE